VKTKGRKKKRGVESRLDQRQECIVARKLAAVTRGWEKGEQSTKTGGVKMAKVGQKKTAHAASYHSTSSIGNV